MARARLQAVHARLFAEDVGYLRRRARRDLSSWNGLLRRVVADGVRRLRASDEGVGTGPRVT